MLSGNEVAAQPPLSFSMPVRVYLEDTDAGGIVYYVNYLKFMERARTEWLRTAVIDFTELLQQGYLFVVHSVQADYRQPARMDDVLVITAAVEKLARSYLVFRQRVLRDDHLLCDAQIKVACIDSVTHKPKPMPAFLCHWLSGE